LSKSTISRTEDSNSNNYIFCKKCNNLLGFEYIKNDEEENKNYTYNYTTPNESNFYLLKKNIKERKNKSINVNFISFKESLLKNIKKEFTNIFNNIQNINIEINLTTLTKQNYEDFSKFYMKKEFDFTFIVHKMEGRIFLLGKNGYYNDVENIFIKKQNSNLYFILISNEVDNVENNKIIEELIYEGGQDKLEKYYQNDRIIFLDNYNLEDDIIKKKDWFVKKIKQIYGGDNINQKKYYINNDKTIYIMDKRKIDYMIEYLNNKEKKGHGCFS